MIRTAGCCEAFGFIAVSSVFADIDLAPAGRTNRLEARLAMTRRSPSFAARGPRLPSFKTTMASGEQ